ncbi:NADH:flavin oxidoreductase/NADH oxidase [Aeriscardovia aeriphila]|uniref:NADH-dependent flavin oxidoreductase n=1 Tax=Aeriscardovia aeriphila TaxID=218139 RepID=A0A261FBB7_9BIFI|nr:NADH:flavin oxidoreductase/NADH oxidase [Aeriscardovia aeriphila]NYI25389.1 2,4-dienoyl-CoA reductase-like NADH-dependent reductase (Old Yellow Enzyme family) [Aeriscardovia aeriphila]OZG56457.1 NADH-dependent flavin oxidoreductase [Aeriscardovia aeriphila]
MSDMTSNMMDTNEPRNGNSHEPSDQPTSQQNSELKSEPQPSHEPNQPGQLDQPNQLNQSAQPTATPTLPNLTADFATGEIAIGGYGQHVSHESSALRTNAQDALDQLRSTSEKVASHASQIAKNVSSQTKKLWDQISASSEEAHERRITSADQIEWSEPEPIDPRENDPHIANALQRIDDDPQTTGDMPTQAIPSKAAQALAAHDAQMGNFAREPLTNEAPGISLLLHHSAKVSTSDAVKPLDALNHHTAPAQEDAGASEPELPSDGTIAIPVKAPTKPQPQPQPQAEPQLEPHEAHTPDSSDLTQPIIHGIISHTGAMIAPVQQMSTEQFQAQQKLEQERNDNLPALFQPYTLHGLTMRNRLWLPPMDTYSAGLDAVPTDFHYQHYVSRALGGFGMVIVESTAVTAEGRISPADLGLFNDAQASAFARITQGIRQAGAVAAIELNHAGRKASSSSYTLNYGHKSVPLEAGGWHSVSPSALTYGELNPPRALEHDEIISIIDAFVRSAQLAVQAGFQAIEIHAAHGYLLNQFLDPLSNHRSDEYGGSLENRERLVLQVCKAVRQAIGPDVALLVRISAVDWTPGGWSIDDSVHLCTQLKALGVDLIDVSTGGVVAHDGNPQAPLWQVPFSARIRSRVGIPVSAVGGITKPKQAEKVVAHGKADVVEIGRAALREPYWPLKAAWKLGVPDQQIPYPVQYRRGMFTHEFDD